ncbi:CZB domain-containing protein [Photobacterium sp. J15]
MKEKSHHMQSVIHTASVRTFLDTVKLDHAVWKNNIYQKIALNQFNTGVNSHKECRLGKWYFEGSGAKNFSHLNGFKKINSPHEKVHSSGREALQAGMNNEFELMLQHINAMESASEEVVFNIDGLLEEILH